jgi:hypothetical protein
VSELFKKSHVLVGCVLEEKEKRISMETALPQALTYMAAHPNGEQPMFGLVTNGHGFAFVKVQRSASRNGLWI